MRLLFPICVISFTFVVAFCTAAEEDDFYNDLSASCNSECTEKKRMNKTVEAMKNIIGALGRQMLLQQLFLEERIRSEADSGVKQVRHTVDGTRNYYSASHTGGSVVSIHDHSNNIRTVGMGEVIAVLNGIEFRTRHNDYRLYMPHRTKKDLHHVEDIPFPDVPPEVLSKKNVSDQIEEMRAWFKAWKDQDYKIRDYRKYFKPVLCYLEGAWTKSTDGKIDEPFESDRHFVDASSWFDLQEKIRFTSYTGRKDNLENFSFLPTTIMNVTEQGYPEFAQWNYRIACHPLSRDLPLNRLRVVDELGLRMSSQRTYREHGMSRAARFQINPIDTGKWSERRNGARYGLLDDLMSEIPGKDNYQGNLTDDAFNIMTFSKNPKIKDRTPLRADRYHRWFEVAEKGAMGISTRHRGYSDANVFMARNTQPKIAGMDLTRCIGKGKTRVCTTINQKWSYAIPLEIIYLTPLSNWNPYGIQYKGNFRTPLGKTVEKGGRNGGLSLNKAFNGTHSKKFYQTPVEFFSGGEVGSGAADTTRNVVGLLDTKGNLRKCKASGTRIFFPQIAGVGVLRQRYPIMPVHGEGSSVWKELEATKDLLLKSKTNGYIFHEPLTSTGGPSPSNAPPKNIRLQMQRARRTPPGPHVHELVVTPDELDFVNAGGSLKVTTEQAAGHDHTLHLIRSNRRRMYITHCDGADAQRTRCWDQHDRWVIVMPNQNQ